MNHLAEGVNRRVDKLSQLEEINTRLSNCESKFKGFEEKILKIETVEKIIDLNSFEKPVINNKTINSNILNKEDQLYKKIEDLEDLKHEIGEIFDHSTNKKTKIVHVGRILKAILKEIEAISKECIKLENNQKEIQIKFVNILRNKDMQNEFKKDKIMIEKLSGSEIEKLHKEISEKNKRIVIIENNNKYLNTEVEFLKMNLNSKFNELQKSLYLFQKNGIDQGLDFMNLKNTISIMESTLVGNLNKMTEEANTKRFSFGKSESDEKRLKRSFESSKGGVEELNKSLTPVYSKRGHSKLGERTYNFSPRMSSKYRT